MPGLNVMLGQDFYPEGHQGGVVIIQNGRRVASNGDLRLEACPGQWSAVPRQTGRQVDRALGSITASFAYPDPDKDRKGFNPIAYPDLRLEYRVTVSPRDQGFLVRVDLDQPLPPEWVGRVGFNLELFPGHLFGRAYTMYAGEAPETAGPVQRGLFPLQPDGAGLAAPAGPASSGSQSGPGGPADQPRPLASGRRLVVAPELPEQRLCISLRTPGCLQLLDGRSRHNNGWFVVHSPLPAGLAAGAVEWLVEPAVLPGFLRQPVIQHNQAGYHPAAEKRAWVELDRLDQGGGSLELLRLDEAGGATTRVLASDRIWGEFLRYRYLVLDFGAVTTPGWYQLAFRQQRSMAFRIDPQAWSEGIWQPTLDYFLPVQMCHLRVEDGYRVWHGACHRQDAAMAPTKHNHFDGYIQGPDTLCRHQSGQTVPGLDQGGWHDAGDFDLRIESQAGTVHGLALAREQFGVDRDTTRVDQAAGLVVLRNPDGEPDILQQIEHGLLSILGGWKSLGRLYRGIIEADIPDYVLLGDPVNHRQQRLVFTQDNPWHQLGAAAALAAASRVLAPWKPALAAEALDCALEQWRLNQAADPGLRLGAALELLLCHTARPAAAAPFAACLLDAQAAIAGRFGQLGPLAVRALPIFQAAAQAGSPEAACPAWNGLLPRLAGWEASLRTAARAWRDELGRLEQETPYGLPYRPHIWGAGWGIQQFGVQLYWLNRHLPELFEPCWMGRAFDFVLGCHPGENNASLVSGVGAKSVTTAYGLNRADWSYIPGGSVSGTALIRPDLPELLDWPYLWQQTEYVLGGGTTDWLFLALAMDQHYQAAPATPGAAGDRA